MEQISLEYKQRKILLMPFPFSDQSGKKVRPVLILSNNSFNDSSQDVIVCAITTNLAKNNINITNESLEEGRLFSPCSIKPKNILKIDKKMVIKEIGKIDNKTFLEVQTVLYELFKTT